MFGNSNFDKYIIEEDADEGNISDISDEICNDNNQISTIRKSENSSTNQQNKLHQTNSIGEMSANNLQESDIKCDE